MHLQTAAEQEQSKLMKPGTKWELYHELLVRKNCKKVQGNSIHLRQSEVVSEP